MGWVDVTVLVPEDRVGAFYEAVGQWLDHMPTPPPPVIENATLCAECGTPFETRAYKFYCGKRCSGAASRRRHRRGDEKRDAVRH